MLSAISIHSLHTEGDAISSEPIAATISFQSTPSTRRETSATSCTGHGLTHFNPLPPHGGRLGFHCFSPPRCYFHPLPPHGGRRYAMVSGADSSSFQSTPYTRRETVTPFSSVSSLLDFNPLPPHGGRLCVVLVFPPDCTFQSTPSTRRETVQPILHWVRQVNFNPLPPHGGRQ